MQCQPPIHWKIASNNDGDSGSYDDNGGLTKRSQQPHRHNLWTNYSTVIHKKRFEHMDRRMHMRCVEHNSRHSTGHNLNWSSYHARSPTCGGGRAQLNFRHCRGTEHLNTNNIHYRNDLCRKNAAQNLVRWWYYSDVHQGSISAKCKI